jgi:hypothetical protein
MPDLGQNDSRESVIERSLAQTDEAIAASRTAIGIAERYRTALLAIRDMDPELWRQQDMMRDIAREALAPCGGAS